MRGFKKSGGFLNNVAGVIEDYQFVTEIEGVKKKAPVKGKEQFNSLFVKLDVKQDGADEVVSTHLWAGGADDFEISDDGHVLTPVDGTSTLRSGTAFAKFIESMIETGFPESNFPEDETEIDFTAIIGTRVQFKQQKDEDATKRLGKRKDKKTGKEYDRNELVADRVLSLPGTAESGKKAAGKPAGKPAAKTAPAAKGKAGKPAAEDYSEEAAAAVVRYAEAAGDEGISAKKLRMKVLTDKEFKGETEKRDGVIAWIIADKFANLAGIDGITVDGDTVTLG